MKRAGALMGLTLLLLAWGTAAPQVPTEPPAPFVVPPSTPDSLKPMMLDVARQMVEFQRFTFEAIRGRLVKEAGRQWIEAGNPGSTWVAFSGVYDSSSYVVIVSREAADTSVITDHRSGTLSKDKYSDGVWIKSYSNKFWANWILAVP